MICDPPLPANMKESDGPAVTGRTIFALILLAASATCVTGGWFIGGGHRFNDAAYLLLLVVFWVKP